MFYVINLGSSEIRNIVVILFSIAIDPSLDIHHIIEPLLQQVVGGSSRHHAHLAW